MMSEVDGAGTSPLLVFKVGAEPYAIQVDNVLELLTLQNLKVTPLPGTPEHVQGVINLRGRTICVQNVRKLFGKPSMKEQNDGLITQFREFAQDHKEWIEALQESVWHQCEFPLEVEPGACAFGQWYDALLADSNGLQRLTQDQVALVDILGRFNTPHEKLHAIAPEVTKLVIGGQTDQANELIEKAKQNELKDLLELFDKACDLVRRLHTGVVVVVERGDRRAGLVVDSVCDVKDFPTDGYLPHNLSDNSEWLQGFVHDEATEDLIQVIGLDLFSGFGKEKAAFDPDDLAKAF
ncbi:chemotaxis protein CheW [Roseiconus lacunae]|uniref:chemotaxis protein CheW n=1 Tax=Roseiconus lacunae TaxID=2605694 RepID=UPI0030924252|nr:chemotaxis protein CheW [Stieleria sp. HD01]